MTTLQEGIPTTVDLLERVRALIYKEKTDGKPVSDYALGNYLGWSRSRISSYMTGRTTLDESGCQTVADVLNLPLETLLACVQLERATKQGNDTLSRAWERVCHRVAVGVFPFFIGLFSTFHFFG